MMSSKTLPIPPELLALGLAALALAGVLWWRARLAVPAGSSLAREAGSAVGGGVLGAGVGVVEGIGQAMGIPRTDATQCEQLLAAGDYWNASFACPASDFIRGAVFGTKPTHEGGASGSW